MSRLDHNLEAEASVIGGVVLGGVVPELEADDFYDGRHRTIWEGIQQMHRKGELIDLVTINNILRDTGTAEQAGGATYVAHIAELTPGYQNLSKYAEIVKENSLVRKLGGLCQDTLESIRKGRGVSSALDNHLSAALKLAGESGAEGESTKDGMIATVKAIEEAVQNPRQLLGISTGLRDLDKITHGLRSADLIIVCARPSVGKTSLALDIAIAAGNANNKVCLFSLEMSSQDVYYRMLSSQCGIPATRLECGNLSQKELKDIVLPAARRIARLDLIVDDRSGLTEMQIYSAVQKHQPDIVFIDYLGLMKCSGPRKERYLEIGTITAAMKAMAKEMKIPVVLLSQLNRESEYRNNPRPKLSDLRESGNIEQDADVVISIYRDRYGEEQNPSLTELAVLKNRKGSLGGCRVTFLQDCTSFRNKAREGGELSE
jgi:replicative DNA helicase